MYVYINVYLLSDVEVYKKIHATEVKMIDCDQKEWLLKADSHCTIFFGEHREFL